MDLNEKRIRWAIDLMGTEIERADLASLRSGLLAFFSEQLGLAMVSKYRVAMATPLEHPLPQDFSKEDFLALQAHVKASIENVVSSSGNITQFPFRGRMAVLCTPWGDYLNVNGPTQDCVLFLLSFALINQPRGKIRRCKEEACLKIFYRSRRQTHCSTRCTNRAMQRMYQERQRKKERERQRRKYEKKVKQKLGDKVKIHVRPKKRRDTR